MFHRHSLKHPAFMYTASLDCFHMYVICIFVDISMLWDRYVLTYCWMCVCLNGSSLLCSHYPACVCVLVTVHMTVCFYMEHAFTLAGISWWFNFFPFSIFPFSDYMNSILIELSFVYSNLWGGHILWEKVVLCVCDANGPLSVRQSALAISLSFPMSCEDQRLFLTPAPVSDPSAQGLARSGRPLQAQAHSVNHHRRTCPMK
jgi:hypothetical protein